MPFGRTVDGEPREGKTPDVRVAVETGVEEKLVAVRGVEELESGQEGEASGGGIAAGEDGAPVWGSEVLEASAESEEGGVGEVVVGRVEVLEEGFGLWEVVGVGGEELEGGGGEGGRVGAVGELLGEGDGLRAVGVEAAEQAEALGLRCLRVADGGG